MLITDSLEPRSVFKFFGEISQIPRGSGNVAKIAEYLTDFAAARSLEHYRDAHDNVIIIKEASRGAENAAPIILQGHTDMVCERAADCKKDMECEGLDLAAEGDFIFARGTTLGGDDGIAVAMMLALLDDDEITHPRLEAVFTSDEEIGMLGAEALDVSPLRGKTMMNIDSEDEGVFTVGCAGGCNTVCRIPITRAAAEGELIEVTVDGLVGGHSGVEINKGRANADKLLGRLLYRAAQECEIRLVSVGGGLKDNAIPCRAAAVMCTRDAAAVERVCEELGAELADEYRVCDGGIRISAAAVDTARNENAAAEGVGAVGAAALAKAVPMDSESTRRVITMLMCIPNGVQKMSAEIDGMVETSLNLGIVRTAEEYAEFVSCIRSSVESEKRALRAEVECLARSLGGTAEILGDYPGWEYRSESPLRDAMRAVFEKRYGYAPKIETIHAGLECGIFAGKLDGLDCVSFGPQIDDIHTHREKMSISSVGRVWNMVVEVIEKMAN